LSVTIVIPARYDSVRFPGKILAATTGKPLIQHVYDRSKLANGVNRVIVATDDDRIADAVRSFGGEAVITRRDHLNGTSRIAEVAAGLDSPIIVNVQGDEPEIEPLLIERAVETLKSHPDCAVSTVAAPFDVSDDPSNPNIVKVVIDQAGRAMYFSRSLIPFDRDGPAAPKPLRHVGLYVYRREFLAKYATLTATPLEQAEKLEQLRVLEHGHRIAVWVETDAAIVRSIAAGIDTPEQYEAFVRRQSSASHAIRR